MILHLRKECHHLRGTYFYFKLGSSWFCERLGRRTGNIINQLPFIFCGILSVVAKYAASPELLMAGRFLAGLGAGAGCTYVPVYLTEIAPTKIRGS